MAPYRPCSIVAADLQRRRRAGATPAAAVAASAASVDVLVAVLRRTPWLEVRRAALATSFASRWMGARRAAAAASGGRGPGRGAAAASRTEATLATTAAGAAAASGGAAAAAPGAGSSTAFRRRGPDAGSLAGSSVHSGVSVGLKRRGGKKGVSVVWFSVQVVRSRPVSQYIGHGALVPRSRHYGPIGGGELGCLLVWRNCNPKRQLPDIVCS